MMIVSPQSLPPSRYSNPFATCWTKPGALPFQFPAGQSAESVVARLAATNWRGAIIGPHGAGKSTLLATLVPALKAAGRYVNTITLRDGQRCWPPGFLRHALAPPQPLLIIDGYEQLWGGGRIGLDLQCRCAAAGLLVTSHASTWLPTLVELKPDLQLVMQLTVHLRRRVPSPITLDDVAASYACHGCNVREIMFDLYDRHERASRAARTANHSVA